MSDSVRPHRQQPTRLPRPWDSPGKNTVVGCHFLLQCVKVKVKSLSRIQPLATSWTAAYQAPPSMGFSRQKYRSGSPFPSPCIAAAAAKSLQSCLTLCDPIDGSPPGSPVPGILQARTLDHLSPDHCHSHLGYGKSAQPFPTIPTSLSSIPASH